MSSNHSVVLSARCIACTPFYYYPREHLIDGISDSYIALFLPIIVYWLSSVFFHCLDISGWTWLERYKIHESEQMKSRNLVSMSRVIWMVLAQQAFQTLVGFWWMTEERRILDHEDRMYHISTTIQHFLNLGQSGTLHQLAYLVYWWFIPAAQLLSAMLIFDTWQYFVHRLMHTNKFLYRHIHSWHHRLYVPYAFGALYNHPAEGWLADTMGLAIVDLSTTMSTRQLIVLFVLLTLKNVDHHCGYRLPFDPLQMFTSNDADFHDIHHQAFGMKSNFSQSFFLHWDVVLGTRLTRNDVKQRRQLREVKMQ